MSAITTHVLDTSKGRPAVGVRVVLELDAGPEGWRKIGDGVTDADGRCRALYPAGARLEAGIYRMTFETGPYFAANGIGSFHPWIPIVFEVTSPAEHHHVPLLLSPFGYSTYRGS